MKSWHIHIEGQVQGVGFRPFVYLMAQEYGLTGWVNNNLDGLHIEFNAEDELAKQFKTAIVSKAPELARITSVRFFQIGKRFFDSFQIIHSSNESTPNLLLTPDFALCDKCRCELHEVTDRRQHYPFITCTNCGPRFSIIHRLPYDRCNTKMATFQMCSTCQKEYDTSINRRYYSQTNSCSECAVKLSLYDNKLHQTADQPEEIFEKIIHYWETGKIVAIKGIGGYLLTSDAGNELVIQRLRQLKYRPTKPFALMFPDIETIDEEASLSEKEIVELKSYIAPIVLLNLKNKLSSELQRSLIAPNLNQIAVMLPYTPLFDLLLQKFGKPIVATSANISNSPIIFEDERGLEALTNLADYILTNNRQIVIPQDDSVLKFSSFQNQKIILRRSRGLAPTFIQPELQLSNETIFAAGAMLKSSFSFLHQSNVFISQYLGNLENFDTLENYRFTAHHFFKLFKSSPKQIICDNHSGYASTIFAEQLAQDLKCPILKVQHHEAHFAAILGEHNLLNNPFPVLGVIWDGTGLGKDRQIWGGEFFIYEKYQFERIGHLPYFDFILGDKMPREPRISALSICKNIPESSDFLRNKFSDTEWSIYQKMLDENESLQTSSIGRLFDAVASLLNICDKQSFEGEAAMLLETKALEYFKEYGQNLNKYYQFDQTEEEISTSAIILGILKDIEAKKSIQFIAAKFHLTLVKLIAWLADKNAVQEIAFSGGVFQNSVLVDLIIFHLREKYNLYFHEQLSPNDENISFGQVIYYQIQQLLGEKEVN